MIFGTIETNELSLKELSSTPSTPSGYSKLYPKADGKLYYLDDSGAEKELVGNAEVDAKIKAQLNQLDFQDSVIDKDILDSTLITPLAGDRYFINGIGASDFLTYDYQFAVRNAGNTAWDFHSPDEGTYFETEDENLYYWWDGSALAKFEISHSLLLASDLTDSNYTGKADYVIVVNSGEADTTLTKVRHEQSFVDADLTAGVLTVTHDLNKQYCQVIMVNNTNDIIAADDITFTSTTVTTIYLTSYGTLTGTWQVLINR